MNCRACGSPTVSILDLGDQYLSDFRDDDEKPPRFPLDFRCCVGCHLAQLGVTVPRELVYHERYGFKSGVNDTIRADLRSIVDGALAYKPEPRRWLDIACNDGTLLSYVPRRVYRAGVDPVEKHTREALRVADEVITDFFEPGYYREPFDVITSISVFYDIDDPNGFVEDVKAILAPYGLWVVQQNYLLTMLEQNAVDNICHEHLTYYSLLSLESLLDRHGLEVVRVSESTVNGGSFRTYIGRKGVFQRDPSVWFMRDWERQAGLNTIAPLQDFAGRARMLLHGLNVAVKVLRSQGGRVYIYGASTRGGTLWQGAGLTSDDLPFAVDRNPDKVGRKIASLGTPIISEEQARKDNPEFMLVSPWFFRDEFVEREKDYLAGGGTFIFPLPELSLVP